MQSPGEFAEVVRGMAARVRPVLLRVAAVTAVELERRAKDYIGEERPEWKPLSPRTIRDKLKLGYGNQVSPTDPLLRTGHLRSSITGEVVDDDPMIYVIIGSDDLIAPAHELGTARIPPRPFLALALEEEAPLGLIRLSRVVGEIFG